MQRLLDILLSATGLIVASPLLLFLIIVGFFDTRAPLFKQTRVGLGQKGFTLIKLRTMNRRAVSVATHLADPSDVTRWGRFLRHAKLDELPQLWNVLRGDMSLVGPRPCLFSQEELIHARERLGVFKVRPGITGLGQINNIDMSTPELLAETDAHMLESFGIRQYLKYLLMTVAGKGLGDRITR